MTVTLKERHSRTCLTQVYTELNDFALETFGVSCDVVCVALPVHCDLPVQIPGERDPGDGTSVVVGVHTTEGHHTALLRVASEESGTLLIYLSSLLLS